MDLTEAEDIKKRWQEYTEVLYKKDLPDPDNHNGVITDLEPDILECEVKWALGTNEWAMLSNHVILCHPLLLLPSIFPSIRVFSNQSALHIRWPKYWHFSFSISPSNKYSGLISFGIDWLDLLAVQGTLESLLQHHS